MCHRPRANDTDMLNYLSNSLSLMKLRFPCCGFILLGDFNKFNTTGLRTGYELTQLVKFPSQGSNILDIVLTKLSIFLDQPIKRAPFGLSDHMSIAGKNLLRVVKTKHPTRNVSIPRASRHVWYDG